MSRKNQTLGLIVGFFVGGTVAVICIALLLITSLVLLSLRDQTDQASSAAATRPVFLLPTPSQGDREAISEMPTPIGFPETAQDVGTVVGQPASAFELQDDAGQLVAVTPGQTGRPTVLIFNMGLG